MIYQENNPSPTWSIPPRIKIRGILETAMKHKLDKLSVFFPAYNEEDNIRSTVESALKVLPSVAKTWEVIIVNDGSKDNTLKVARGLAGRNKSVRVVNHEVNRGYGAAFKSGFYSAKYPWIVFTDADGQFDFSEIDEFIETQRETNADLVIGYYKDRKVTFVRKLNSFLWQVVVYILFGLSVKDIDCGFKLVSKKVIDKIPKLESERGAFVSSEFLINARKKGFKIVEVPVSHYPRKSGKATGANIDVIVQSFVDLFKLWKRLR